MPEPLKNVYSQAFFQRFSEFMTSVRPQFNATAFLNRVIDAQWEERELKNRMHHIASVLTQFLPEERETALSILIRLSRLLLKQAKDQSFAYMFIPDFIEQSCLDDPGLAINAFEEITQFTSCEFAVRPFIIKYPDLMMDQMQKWASHPHENVRRFASEGCRPRLPWAMSIDFLKKDPGPILPILKKLKNDASTFVQKSVANNLNDISKDHPHILISLIQQWKGRSPDTDWILKHGSRTLLKQGHPQIMPMFNLNYDKGIKIEGLKLKKDIIKIGEELHFEFQLINGLSTPTLIRLEYGIYFSLANHKLSRKVFKISEKIYPGHTRTTITRKHSFRIITTRRFYPGKHLVSLICNGVELTQLEFTLIE